MWLYAPRWSRKCCSVSTSSFPHNWHVLYSTPLVLSIFLSHILAYECSLLIGLVSVVLSEDVCFQIILYFDFTFWVEVIYVILLFPLSIRHFCSMFVNKFSTPSYPLGIFPPLCSCFPTSFCIVDLACFFFSLWLLCWSCLVSFRLPWLSFFVYI